MSSIDLRVSNVNPPLPEPKRSIYRDIVNLPDPCKLGVTIRYFNYDNVTLYFQITGAATGYTFGTVNLGSLLTGTDAYCNLDEFASRAKPATETSETIQLILKAYTDSSYTNLKWTFTRDVTVVFIKSNDPSYTVDFLNNFDDGAVQGWAGKYFAGEDWDSTNPILAVANDYVLSPPYSLKASSLHYGGGNNPRRGYLKNLQITINDTVLVFLGRPWDGLALEYFIRDKWIRIIVPLPKNTTLEFRIRWNSRGYLDAVPSNEYRDSACIYKSFTTPNKNVIYAIADVRMSAAINATCYVFVWLDDFKIISKA